MSITPDSWPHVAVIVLNWNGQADTIRCLNSLRRNTYPSTTVYLLDNGSTDDSVEFFRLHYPEVTLMANGQNLGFSAGNNVGLERALKDGAEYFFLLNNDATVAPDTLERLVARGKSEPRSGMIGPKTWLMERPDHFYAVGVLINYWVGWTREIGMWELDQGQYEQPRQFDAVSGCALMVKREVLEKVGLLDPSFFAYFEEIDWCARTARAGFEIWYEPKARVWHKGHGSNAGLTRFFLLARNQLLFVKKNTPWPQWLFFWPYYFFYNLPKQVLRLALKKEWRRLWVLFQAVGWNFGLFHHQNPLTRITSPARTVGHG